jgi:SAM-dependent methyltransferase
LTDAAFEALLAEGMGVDVEAAWGVGFLTGRYLHGVPPWTWPELAGPLMRRADRALDMGTGDGSALAELAPFASLTVAYEEWLPTVPAAVRTLRPLGGHVVVALGSADNIGHSRAVPRLPFRGASFDLVLNRHEAFDPFDVRRLLSAGGSFVTQQVGHDQTASVRALLGLPTTAGRAWCLDEAVRQVESAGLEVVNAGEARPAGRFTDVAALVAFLRSVPWEVPGFDLERFRPQLVRVHERCVMDGGAETVEHRFHLTARRD